MNLDNTKEIFKRWKQEDEIADRIERLAKRATIFLSLVLIAYICYNWQWFVADFQRTFN